jgi:HAD superfamily hydrolase (TIGR01509 family)
VSLRPVLIDLDGTLVHSASAWDAAERRLLRERGIATADLSALALDGRTLEERIAAISARHNLTESPARLAEELEASLLKRFGEVRSVAGAAAFVEALHQVGAERAIVSNSPHRLIEAALRSKSWARLVQLRVSSEDVGVGKPDPSLLHLAASRLGVRSEDCLVVEDSETGAAAAVAAGMVCVAVSRSASERDRLSQFTPIVCRSLDEVLPLVLSLIRQPGPRAASCLRV